MESALSPKIIVTDAQHRKALAAIRSLGRQGFRVIAAGPEAVTMGGVSRFCHQRFHYPDPVSKPAEFVESMADYVRTHAVDVILPMEDLTVELLSRARAKFMPGCQIPVPDPEVFMVGRDKELTLKEALKAGLPCPKTGSPASGDEVRECIAKLGLPLVIKPRISAGSRGLTFVSSVEECVAKYNLVAAEYSRPLLQEAIPSGGCKYQILMLLDEKQQLKAVCSQELLRQFPVEAGPGTLYKTVRLPELEALSAKFLQQIGWVGVACMEFITDPRTGDAKFMELNPRFWGTLNLSIQAGVDFPGLLAAMALGKDFAPVLHGQIDLYCQWLLPGDFLNFVFNKNRFHQSIPYFFGKPDAFCYAILSRDDLRPVFWSGLSLILEMFSRRRLKDVFKRGK